MMSDDLCKHGKRPMTQRDLDAYCNDARRVGCRQRGDCDCPICSKVCWLCVLEVGDARKEMLK